MRSDFTTLPPAAKGLALRFRQDGFAEGPPPSLSAEALAIDQAAYRRYPCPCCRRRRQVVRPFHKGCVYRLLLVCRNPECGHQVEA